MLLATVATTAVGIPSTIGSKLLEKCDSWTVNGVPMNEFIERECSLETVSAPVWFPGSSMASVLPLLPIVAVGILAIRLLLGLVLCGETSNEANRMACFKLSVCGFMLPVTAIASVAIVNMNVSGREIGIRDPLLGAVSAIPKHSDRPCLESRAALREAVF